VREPGGFFTPDQGVLAGSRSPDARRDGRPCTILDIPAVLFMIFD
jgi:hypothetical protein